jgi:hypothetical protein
MVAYHRPGTLHEALAIRAAGDVMVLAGATDVYPAKAARSAWGDMPSCAELPMRVCTGGSARSPPGAK